MRLIRDLTALSGAVALAAALVLLSPGVHAVRADDAGPHAAFSLSAVGDGPTCEAGTIAGGEETLDILRDIQRKAAQQANAAEGDFVVLNGRGYNYGAKSLDLPFPTELRRAR
ncbi:MAG: hypothetical protein ACE5FL_01445 [Myxococcota bacterium]